MLTKYWIECPICKNPKMQLVRSDTKLVNFPAYCKKCKNESVINLAPKSQVMN